MGAHNDTANDYQLFDTGSQTIADPGSGGTFNLRGIDRGVATIASGTRKLPNNVPLGVSLTVYATGSVTITTQAAVTMASLTAGQVAVFTARTSTTWNVAIHATTGDASLNGITTSLTSTQGFIDLPLASWREVTSNDITNAAGNGGVLATDTTPTLEYINGDTDSTLRMLWAATNVDSIVTQFVLPWDLDRTQPILFLAFGVMSGAADTPVLSLDTYFNDLSGSAVVKVEDNTTAFGDAVAGVSATISAADIPSVGSSIPISCTIEVTPGAHGTDSLSIYATYLRYTKKLLTS